MAHYYNDECCGCAVPGYPCRGDSCPNRHVLRYRCDNCGLDGLGEDNIRITDDGEELCEECAMELYPDQFEEDDEYKY